MELVLKNGFIVQGTPAEIHYFIKCIGFEPSKLVTPEIVSVNVKNRVARDRKMKHDHRPQNAHRPWTESDIETLRFAVAKGISTRRIARELRRSLSSVYTRRSWLNRIARRSEV